MSGRRGARAALASLALFAATALTLTWPLARHPTTHVLDDGMLDGFQFVWNLWWVRAALLDLHTSPFYTRHVFFPAGVDLFWHSLSFTTGLLSTPLALLGSGMKTAVAASSCPPGSGAARSVSSLYMAYQAEHGRPLAEGTVARLPAARRHLSERPDFRLLDHPELKYAVVHRWLFRHVFPRAPSVRLLKETRAVGDRLFADRRCRVYRLRTYRAAAPSVAGADPRERP